MSSIPCSVRHISQSMLNRGEFSCTWNTKINFSHKEHWYTGTGNSTYSTCQCRETLTLGNKNPVENKSQKRIKMKTKNINQVYFPFYSCLFSTGINFWWWCIDWSSHIQWSNPSKFFVRNVIIRAKSTGVETTQLVRSRLRDLVLSERCGAAQKNGGSATQLSSKPIKTP